MNPETYTVGNPRMKFGTDFYTEIYDVTRDVGGAVQLGYKNICNAIGWLIVAIGLFDIAYFIGKAAYCNENYSKNNNSAAPTAAPRYITQNKKTLEQTPAKTEKPSVVMARQDLMESKSTQKKVYAEGEFVPGRKYTNGDEVIFENKKYVCVASGTTVWSPSQFPSQWKEISAEEAQS